MEALAAAFAGFAGPIDPDSAAFRSSLEEGYRRWFANAVPVMEGAPGGEPGAAAWARYRAAASRWAGIAAAIAQDAGGRLMKALSETGPDSPPIESLAELQALWIDCGEAAYGDAARGDEFAAAQAELLMSLVELQAPS